MRKHVLLAMCASIFLLTLTSTVQAQDQPVARVSVEPSLVFDDFLGAMELFSGARSGAARNEAENLWLQAFEKKSLSRGFIGRLVRRHESRRRSGVDPWDEYRSVEIEQFPVGGPTRRSAGAPVSLHAVRLDVLETYDDWTRDDIYCFFITTADDQVWGRVTEIYKGLGDGDSTFLTARDRAVFGPKGERRRLPAHLIVDMGIIESDSDDVREMQKISDVIVDLSVVALSLVDPRAAAFGARARAEVKNLMAVILSSDEDDRLVMETMVWTPEMIETQLTGSDYVEFDREWDRETTWTHFNYRMGFRWIR